MVGVEGKPDACKLVSIGDLGVRQPCLFVVNRKVIWVYIECI